MENHHPSTDELYRYIDSPGAQEHSGLRHHLMSCAQCRLQIDNLNQLEMRVKHVLPRISDGNLLPEDCEQHIEQFVDQQIAGKHNPSLQDKINSDPSALKSALHYAVHSVAMSKKSQSSVQTDLSARSGTTGVTTRSNINLLQHIIQFIQRPMPTWVMAPASVAIATVISIFLITQPDSQHAMTRIAAYQDNATISFSKNELPAGSIGFFHDAQSSKQAFSGVNIETSQHDRSSINPAIQDIRIHWPEISNAINYQLDIYFFQDNEKQLLAQQASQQPAVVIENVTLQHGQHYQWVLSGTTNDGFKFKTSGDFVYLDGNS